MNPIHVWRRLRSRFARSREAEDNRRSRQALIEEALEQVVKASTPVICTLRGDCRNALRSPVETAMSHMDQAVAAIPGPVTLSADRWDTDPVLKALFVGPDEISSLLHGDAGLKTAFAAGRPEEVFAMLTAVKKERTIFGTAVEGDVVRRDVAQTAVEFNDHRLVAPAAAEAETRSEVRNLALDALVTQVLEKILSLRSLKEEMIAEQHLLSIKLQIRNTRDHSPDAAAGEVPDAETGADDARQLLADIDRRIRALSRESDSPEEYLRQLAQVLSTPQDVLTVTPISLRLDWMGVKHCGDAGACMPEIRLAEMKLKERFTRAAVIVRVERRDVPQG
jgi:hypothetical protein